MNKLLVPAVVLGLIVIAVVAFFFMGQNNAADQSAMTPTQTVTSEPTATMEAETEGAMTQSQYKDGEYSVVGNYVSPGGPREVNVTITLENGVITESVFEGLATDATSKRFQGEFADNYETLVVGKNIDEVSLTKVSGSSLTPKGFMDALEKVKTEAQS